MSDRQRTLKMPPWLCHSLLLLPRPLWVWAILRRQPLSPPVAARAAAISLCLCHGRSFYASQPPGQQVSSQVEVKLFPGLSSADTVDMCLVARYSGRGPWVAGHFAELGTHKAPVTHAAFSNKLL